MDSLLRIQVRVMARDAARQLQAIGSGIRAVQRAAMGGIRAPMQGLSASARIANSELERINKNLGILSGNQAMTDAGRQAARFNEQLMRVNKTLGQTKAGTDAPWRAMPGPTMKVGDRDKVLAGQAKAAAAQQAAHMKQVWNQQVRDARNAKKAIDAADKQAQQAAKQRQRDVANAARQSFRIMQQDAKRAAAVERAERARVARDAKIAFREMQNAARETAAAETRAAKQSARERLQAEKQLAAAKLNLSKKQAAAAKLVDESAFHKDQFVGGLAKLDRAVNGVVDRTRQGMLQFGKNMQWVGRQINFNFTLPLMAAATFIFRWEQANEAAFTRLKKVYGDSAKDYTGELNKVRHAMTLLSDIYGVSQSEVIELGAKWAAAGLQAGALARAVENSLKLSILGDYTDMEQVFTDLITIQSAFQLSTEDTAKAIAELNTVENMTAATLPQLVEGISKAGSAAHVFGVDIEHLAAMMAVLVPATGSAATAGTSLKTILSRLAQPTADIVQALKDIGISYFDTSFQMLSGTGRLELIAEKFSTLTGNQQAWIASIITGRRQVNQFTALMQDMIQVQGTYNKVVAALDPANYAKNWKQANQEVDTLLQSSPRRLAILKTQMQNMLADVIQPLIPAIIGFVGAIRGAVQWFSKLNPKVQVAIFVVLGLVAAVGILAQAFGAMQLLFAQGVQFLLGGLRLLGIGTIAAGSTAEIAAAKAAAVSAAMAVQTAQANLLMLQTTATATGVMTAETAAAITAMEAEVVAASQVSAAAIAAIPAEAAAGIGIGMYALIAAVVVALSILVYHFRKQIGNAFKSIWEWAEPARDFIGRVFGWIGQTMSKAFHMLPDSVQKAMLAVARIIASAIKTIRKWLSYLNPFARHSPSLVDNVKAGLAVIAAEYASVADRMSVLRRAADDLRNFADATKELRDAERASNRKEQKKQIVSGSPNAGPWVDALYQDLDELYAILDDVSGEIKAQEEVVKPLEDAYRTADRAVRDFEAGMAPLAANVAYLEKRMNATRDALDKFANTPITGMKAMSDQIFENEMAQRRLRLELLQMDEAGTSYDDLRERIARLNGDIENVRATMSDLRSAGAGSDVLKTYQDQLDALELQKKGLDEAAAQGNDLTKQLADLQRAGEVLDLQKSLQFDPLTRQIEDLANATQEMSFDEIIAGVREQRSALDDLTRAYGPQKAALDAQQEQLDRLVLTRDTLKAAYDVENNKLQDLKDTYQEVTQAINDIEQALTDAARAADALSSARGGGGAGAGGGFADIMGGEDPTQIMDDMGGDLDAMIAEWENKVKGMFKFDPFGSIRNWWGKFKGWWTNSVVPAADELWDALWDVFSNIRFGKLDLSAAWEGMKNGASNAADFIQTQFVDRLKRIFDRLPFKKQIGDAFGWIADELPGWFEDAGRRIGSFFTRIGRSVAKFGELFEPLKEAATHVLNNIKRIIGVIEWGIKAVIAVLSPLIFAVGAIFYTAFNIAKRIIGPIFETIGKVISAALDIIRNTIGFFLALINGDWGKAWDAIKGIFAGIWDGITAIVTGAIEVIKGIITGLVDSVVNIFSFLWEKVGSVVTNGFEAVVTFFREAPGKLVNGLKELPGKVMGLFGEAWDKAKKAASESFDKFLTWAKEVPGKVVTALGDLTRVLWDKGKDLFQGLVNGANSLWDSFVNWIKGWPASILRTAGRALDILYQWGRDLAQGFWDGFKAVWNWIADRLTFTLPKIHIKGTDIDIGGGTFSLLPHLAHGGGYVDPRLGYEQHYLLKAGEFVFTQAQVRALAGMGIRPGAGRDVSDGPRELHFHGDLSFPNITDPNDAEKFISNLETLAGVR